MIQFWAHPTLGKAWHLAFDRISTTLLSMSYLPVRVPLLHIQDWSWNRRKQLCCPEHLKFVCCSETNCWIRGIGLSDDSTGIVCFSLRIDSLRRAINFWIFLRQGLVFFWVPGSMLSCFLFFLLFAFSAFCFSCFSAFHASLLYLLLFFSASLLSLLLCFSAFVLLCLSTSTILLVLVLFFSHVFLLLYFLLLCFFASCLYCLFVCFLYVALFSPVYILSKTPKTLGETQRNRKEILMIRNPYMKP